MAVILGLFYFGQDDVLADEAAVKRAVDNAIEWLLEAEYTNVVVEIANESNFGDYDHEILDRDRIGELVSRVARIERDGYRYPVSTSVAPGKVPPDDILEAGNIGDKFLQRPGNADAIRPMLVGMDAPVHVIQRGDEVKDIVNVAEVAAIDAQQESRRAERTALSAYRPL